MTQLVGIANITPDSFSDGGLYDRERGLRTYLEKAVALNIPIIDIGAESTRPGATPLSSAEECERLEPVLGLLADYKETLRFSLDTRHPETAEYACKTGLIAWINDVSGLANHDMCTVIKDFDVHYVLMHSLSVPANPDKVMTKETDCVREIRSWCTRQIATLVRSGVAHSNIIFDPGIGFGKTAQQSLLLLQRVSQFRQLGLPILIGHSRKSFLNLLGERDAKERDLETALCSYYLTGQKVDYLRIHNMEYHARMLALFHTLHDGQ